MTATYTSVDEFASSVDSTEGLSRDTELKGCPRDVTIGSLIGANGELTIEAIYTSALTNAPVPIGALVRVESLGELSALTNVFGLHVMSDITMDNDGSATVGLHFD